jgi:hypothetical protein
MIHDITYAHVSDADLVGAAPSSHTWIGECRGAAVVISSLITLTTSVPLPQP